MEATPHPSHGASRTSWLRICRDVRLYTVIRGGRLGGLRMRWGALCLAVVAALSAAVPAGACDGSNVLFRDNFAASAPGGALYDKDTVKIGGGSLKLTPLPKRYAFIYYRADLYERADVCV